MIAQPFALGTVTGPIRRAGAWLAHIRPAYVVAAFVSVQWLTTLGLALSVQHTRWLFYHGGDQVWFYTTSRLLLHGLLVPTNVGYGWSILELPFALVGGPNLVNVLPAILLLNVLILMPVAMAAMYGIGERIGGRLFGYWVLFLWIVLPLIGIKYTDTGFKARYTELSLPTSFGLTSLSDFPTMIALVVAAFFCLRALQSTDWTDAALAGAFAGIGIAIKPSSSLFLGGALLALAGCRRWRPLLAFAASLAPFIVTLAFWKWRGLGYVPLFHAEPAVRLAAGAVFEPVAGAINLHKYINLNWHQFSVNLDSLQEHFWSARVFEWTVIAGTLALLRRGLGPFLLFGGWFWAFILIKGTGDLGSLETGGLLRMLTPAIPAFVILVAVLPLLWPGAPKRLPDVPPVATWGTPRVRTTLLAATVILFVVVPIALAGTATRAHAGYASTDGGPIPVDNGIDLHARVIGSRVVLTWKPQHAAGAPIFYDIVAADSGTCPDPPALPTCAGIVGVERTNRHVATPPPGKYDYWVLVGANWRNDPVLGEDYVASNSVTVTVP